MTITYEYEGNLYVNITNRCPNRCRFCIRNHQTGIGSGEDLHLHREPSIEEIIKDIETKELSHYNGVVFCGFGEPTCRLKELLHSCKWIKSTGDIPIRVNTNGLSDLINGRKTASEFEGLVDTMSISLNAPTEEKYDALCHSIYGPAAYQAILTFAQQVRPFVSETILSIVNIDLTQEDVKACEEMSKALGVKFRIREYIE